MAKISIAILFLTIGFALGWSLKPHPVKPKPETPTFPRSVSGSNEALPPSTSSSNSKSQNVSESTLIAQHKQQNSASILARFRDYLNRHQFREAVSYFQEIERYHSGQAPALKKELVIFLKRKIAASDFEPFNTLVEYWLAAFYKDIETLLLLAQYNILQGYYGEAIGLYQLIYSYIEFDGQLSRVDNNFSQFVHRRDTRLMEAQSWMELQNFYEMIEQADIAKLANRYRLAEIYLHNGYLEDARYILLELANTSAYRIKAENLLNKIKQGDYQDISRLSLRQFNLPLERLGNHFVATLLLPNNVSLKLLLDTGASITSVSQASFSNKLSYIDYRYGEPRLFNTANGVVRGEVVQLPQIFIGEFEFNDIDFAIVPMPENELVDGLLGMNILSQFRFRIDQERAELVLERK